MSKKLSINMQVWEIGRAIDGIYKLIVRYNELYEEMCSQHFGEHELWRVKNLMRELEFASVRLEKILKEKERSIIESQSKEIDEMIYDSNEFYIKMKDMNDEWINSITERWF